MDGSTWHAPPADLKELLANTPGGAAALKQLEQIEIDARLWGMGVGYNSRSSALEAACQ